MNLRKFDINSVLDRDLIVGFYALIEQYLQRKGYPNAMVWMSSLQNNGNGFILQYNETILGIIEIDIFRGSKGTIGKLFWFSSLPAAIPILQDYALELAFSAGCTEVQYDEERRDIVVRSISHQEFMARQQAQAVAQLPPSQKQEIQDNGNKQQHNAVLQPKTVSSGDSTASFTAADHGPQPSRKKPGPKPGWKLKQAATASIS